MKTWRSAVLSLFLPAVLVAQAPGNVDSRVFYYPKPAARTPWQPPMKPVTRLADVKARHRGEPGWRELVIHDENPARSWFTSRRGRRTRAGTSIRISPSSGW